MQLLFFFLLFSIIGITVAYSYAYGITPTPTSSKVKTDIIAILPSLSQGNIVELGSGWGTLAIELARRYPQCNIVGYEISPLPFFISKLWLFCSKLTNLTFKRQDFFHIPLNNISLAVCYLYPGAMEKLKEKFKAELPSKAYVISHTFAIPGWNPIRIIYAKDMYHTPIYLYQKY